MLLKMSIKNKELQELLMVQPPKTTQILDYFFVKRAHRRTLLE